MNVDKEPSKFPFSDYFMARRAMALARRIIPDYHWYITNEYGPWTLVQAYKKGDDFYEKIRVRKL